MTWTRSTLVSSSTRRSAARWRLAILVAVLVIPRAAGQESSTLEFDIVMTSRARGRQGPRQPA